MNTGYYLYNVLWINGLGMCVFLFQRVRYMIVLRSACLLFQAAVQNGSRKTAKDTRKDGV